MKKRDKLNKDSSNREKNNLNKINVIFLIVGFIIGIFVQFSAFRDSYEVITYYFPDNNTRTIYTVTIADIQNLTTNSNISFSIFVTNSYDKNLLSRYRYNLNDSNVNIKLISCINQECNNPFILPTSISEFKILITSYNQSQSKYINFCFIINEETRPYNSKETCKELVIEQ